MGPLEYSECSHECLGPFRIITVRIYNIANVKWLEGCIRITELLLVFLTSAYFLHMPRETTPIDMTSRIPEIVDVRSDILVDLLVELVRVVDTVPLAPPGRVVHHHNVDRRNGFCQGDDWILARWIGDSSLSSRKVSDSGKSH